MIHQLGDIETAGVTVNKQNVVESTRMTPGCPLLRNSRKIVIPAVARRSIGKFQFGIGIAYIPESCGFGRDSAAGHFPEPVAAAVAESLVPCKIRDRSLRMEKLVLRFRRRTDRRARLRGSGIYRRKVFSARQIRATFFTITQKRNLANSSANFSGTKTSVSIQSSFSEIPEAALCGFRNFLSIQIHPFFPFRAASAVSPQARTALKQLASRIIIVFMLIHFDHVLNFAVVPDSASLRTPELTGSTALLHFSSCSGGNRERCCCHKILLAFFVFMPIKRHGITPCPLKVPAKPEEHKEEKTCQRYGTFPQLPFSLSEFASFSTGR